MKLGRALIGFGDSVLDRVLCVVGTIAFSQMPEFMQQYLQRLGGHLDEARRQLEQFRRVAEQSGLTLDRLIQQTAANADPAVAKLSIVMNEAATRVDTLETAQSAIQNASLWTRPFAFFRHVDASIAQATLDIYKPAVPTTLEGLVYALLGMFLLLGLYQSIKYPIARASRRRLRRDPCAAPVASRSI